MSNTEHLIACHECDLLIELHSDFDEQQLLSCPRCQHKLISGHKNPLDYVVALSLSAIVTLMFAISFPFLAFQAKGQSRSIDLIDASQELFLQGFPVLAFLVLCFIVLLPLIYLISLLVVTVPVRFRLSRKPPILVGRLVNLLLPWAMAEVLLLGVLVALIKIVAMADIIIGVSFWAYILFAITFLTIANIVDHHRLWEWVEYSPTNEMRRT